FKVEPHVGIALDTTPAVDIPGNPDHMRVTERGRGVGFKAMDSASIPTRSLLAEFIALAQERGIRDQPAVLPPGRRDAGPIRRSRTGVPSITLSTPSRYVHTVTEMVAKSDLEAEVAL